ncbi:MAG: lysylphosphatidylglycerol synthase transmembrane domain-containing protein [Patescibacteria group bacterium]|nr:lysylphosphatidylglycerol synthase transmembrane domain-containing protein [Patescibacteria group bacterium]
MNNKLNVSKVIIGLSLVSLAIQIIASAILIPKLKAPLELGYILLALLFEFLAFAVLTPFARSFYAREKVPFTYYRAFTLLLASESFSHLVPFGDYFAQRFYFDRHKLPIRAPLRYITVLYSFGLLGLITLFLGFQALVFIFYPNKVSTSFAGKFVFIPLVLTGILVALYLLRRSPQLTRRTQAFFQKYLGSKLDSPFSVLEFSHRPIHKNLLLVSPLLFTWLLEGCGYVACLKAFGVQAPILLSFYAYTFVKMFRFIPIFPGGVGEIEATSALLFSSYGFAVAPIITGSILFRFVSYWFPITLGALSARSVLSR